MQKNMKLFGLIGLIKVAQFPLGPICPQEQAQQDGFLQQQRTVGQLLQRQEA
jgi:hypothetical protein